jgi:hypothetical protein
VGRWKVKGLVKGGTLSRKLGETMDNGPTIWKNRWYKGKKNIGKVLCPVAYSVIALIDLYMLTSW